MSTDSKQLPLGNRKFPRVADFSTHFSGPVASRQMVQLGADVIKIEHPRHGDGNRTFPPFFNEEGVSHLHLNAGTRSLALEAGTPLWTRAVEAIAKWADVVIVGNQPATATKLGIDFASMLRHNPRLVYCLISGYGVDGAWSSLPAHGLNMDALAGSLPLEWKNGIPEVPSHYRSVGTTLAGIQAALGIYAALHRRDQGVGGQVVHVSIWESALSWMWRDVVTHANTGHGWANYQALGSRYSVYSTRDGRAILVCPIERVFWERFCDALELPAELRARGNWTRGTDSGSEYIVLGERMQVQEKLLKRTCAEWMDILGKANVPAAPVLDWREAMAADHAAANGTMAQYEYRGRTVCVPTTPVSITSVEELQDSGYEQLAQSHRRKRELVDPPPQLGEHNEDLMKELGITG